MEIRPFDPVPGANFICGRPRVQGRTGAGPDGLSVGLLRPEVNHADRQAGVAKEASGYCMRRARVMAGLGLREASLTSEFETDVSFLTGELHA